MAATRSKRRVRRIARYERFLSLTMAMLDSPTLLSPKNPDRQKLVKEIRIALSEDHTDKTRSDDLPQP